MYILFKKTQAVNTVGATIIGTWGTFDIAHVPEQNQSWFDLNKIKATVLESEGVAKAYVFLGVGYRGHISVKPFTSTTYLLDKDLVMSAEESGEKVQYDLTEQNIADTISLSKAIMRRLCEEHFDNRYTELMLESGALEVASWSNQQQEAAAYRADSEASVPTLTKLAAARGITILEMVEKVEAAIVSFNDKVSTLLANRQAIEKIIKDCASINDCNRVLHTRFGWYMPIGQMEDEGLTTSPVFNMTV